MKKLLATVASTAVALSTLTVPSFASTSQHYPTSHIKINEHPYSALVVDGVTYPLWASLQLLNTPYHYLGNGIFDINGRRVQGVVGSDWQTYLPWNVIAPNIVAEHTSSGMWDFVTKHDYELSLDMKTTAKTGEWIYMLVDTTDNGNPLPNQPISLTMWNGKDNVKNAPTSTSGKFEWAIESDTPDATDVTATWTDPLGQLHKIVKTAKWYASQSTAPQIPSDEKFVADTPVYISNDQVLFDINGMDGQTYRMQLDTGAMTPVLSESYAESMHLQRLQSIQVVGVDGQPQEAYVTKFSFKLGGVEFDNVTGIIYPDYKGTPLFGYSFFNDNHYDLMVSQSHNMLVVMQPKTGDGQ